MTFSQRFDGVLVEVTFNETGHHDIRLSDSNVSLDALPFIMAFVRLCEEKYQQTLPL